MIVAVLVTILFKGGEEIAASISSIVSHQAYVVSQQIFIPEIQADMILYRHKKSQTEVLTIVPTDSDQDVVFGLSVRTPARNNKGTAHALMHSIWDGSEAYPLNDPVHRYHKGSLATLVEATCMEDRTLYIAASRNRKDLNNFMSVMLDALFRPLFLNTQYRDSIFREEAWRLDPVDGTTFEAKNKDLQLNGLTMNLQKAVYTNVDEMITRYARRALFGNTQYQFDAQGVPADIAELRKVDVENFFSKHYSATNTKVFLYGSIDSVHDGLDALDAYAKQQTAHLDNMEKSMPKWQPFNLKKAAEEVHAYPILDYDDEGSHTVVSWLLNDSHMTHKTEFAWRVLEYLLLGTSSSLLRQELEDYVDADVVNATLSTEVIGGLETDYQQWRFSVGIKGITRDQVQSVQNRIDFVLGNIQSFDPDHVAAAMNVVEMKRRDLSSGDQPRGVVLFRQVLTHWNYNREPRDVLAWSAGFKELQDEIANSGDKFLLQLIQDKLVSNTHKVRVQFDPSMKEITKQRNAEKKSILLMRETLSDQDFQKLLDESKALQDKQFNPNDPALVSKLPTLESSDIPSENAKRKSHFSISHQVLTLETPVVSSFGMLFVDFGLDLRRVEYDHIPLLPVVYRLMLESGTRAFTPDRLVNQIGKYSTGITAESMILDVRQKGYNGPLQFAVHDGTHLATKAFFRGRCMAANLKLYMELLSEIIFHGLDFQKDRVVDTINDMIVELESKITAKGDYLVASRLAARYTFHGLIEEQLSGISQLQSLHQALFVASFNWEDLKRNLTEVKLGLTEAHRNGMVLSVTGEAELLNDARAVIEQFLSDGIPRNGDNFAVSNPGEEPHVWIPQMHLANLTSEALILATNVDYVGMGGKLYVPGEAINGTAAVAANYLRRVYLYHELHDKRGVADVFVELSFRHGTLVLISYKDPSLTSTLNVFNKAPDKLLDGTVLPSDVNAAIISTIADLDGSAKQPDEIGWDAIVNYLQDDNSDFAQLWRMQILNATVQDFMDFFQTFAEWKSPSVAVVSDKESYLVMKSLTKLDLQPVCKHWISCLWQHV